MRSQSYFEQQQERDEEFVELKITGLELILKATSLCVKIRRATKTKLAKLKKKEEEQEWHKHQPKR